MSVDVFRDVWSFLRHLRWHYQLAVVSGIYLLGGLYQPSLGSQRPDPGLRDGDYPKG